MTDSTSDLSHEDISSTPEETTRTSKAREVRRQQSEARRAAREADFRAAMREPLPGPPLTNMTVRIGDVQLDRRYQTVERYDDGRARKMAREFDPRRLRPISLNIRPDDETQAIYCYDGQHRIAAAIYREGEDYCMNATLARVSYQEEARLFAEQHQNERQVGRLLKFNALIEAEDANALACRDLAEQLGLTLGHQAQTHMVAATTFVDCYQRWGADATEVGLRCVLNRWGGTATSLEQQIVKGFVFFVKRRSTHPNFVMSRFTDSLQRISLSTLEDKAGDHSKLPDYQGIAAALTDIYNYARRERLPEWNPRGEKA